MKFYPYKKGGAEKVLAMLNWGGGGGAQRLDVACHISKPSCVTVSI